MSFQSILRKWYHRWLTIFFAIDWSHLQLKTLLKTNKIKQKLYPFLFQDATPRIKIVVALYPFKAIEGGDLSLEKVCIFFLKKISSFACNIFN